MRSLLVIMLVFFITSSKCDASNSVRYYKCTTERGSVYSKHPCPGNATQYQLVYNDAGDEVTAEQQLHYKTLNNIEKTQIIRNLQREISKKRHDVAMLNQKRDRAEREQQAKLDKASKGRDSKKVNKEVQRSLKAINKDYFNQKKVIDKEIDKLEKKLKRFVD
ncbi:DUF4124 domain-containing protein [Pseudoalteromonas sp. T1lg65]|uniref:DUF4124 domain-containing protein n=1 Tax=Pseudoalteromonas sp. T1lg65 TaxID=2077101 RepID=UPI003F79BBD6